MKYILTGSLGHITKPIALALVKAGHSVTIISSNADRKEAIEQIGATAAIGSVEDATFLTTAFSGADAVYLMIPPHFGTSDWFAYQQSVSTNYVNAIKANNIKYAMVLSSVGAHMRKGAGPIDGVAYLEQQIESIPGMNSILLRPSYFYYNLLSLAGMLKHAGIMGSAQPAEHKMVLTHTDDIAETAVAYLLALDFKGITIRYIASDERSWSDITNVLTAAVNKPAPYVMFTDEQSREGMLQAGLSPVIAEGYVALGAAIRSKEMEADYWNNRPSQLGKVKLEDFAKEFAAVYLAS